MPRVNIYLNDSTNELVQRWKDKISFSDVFARALRDEISAIEDGKDIRGLVDNWAAGSEIELRLADLFGLKKVITIDAKRNPEGIRNSLGLIAAKYVDFSVSDAIDFCICGGRQVWQVVKNLGPRRVQINVRAYGIELSERGTQHVHSNTLATIIALLYQPRSTTDLIVRSTKDDTDIEKKSQRKIILGSCSRYQPSSEFSLLLGKQENQVLSDKEVEGEFGYCFWDSKRNEVKFAPNIGHRRFSRKQLEVISREQRNDVILVAGGDQKLKSILAVLNQRMCNVLVTTNDDAIAILSNGGHDVTPYSPSDN